MRRSVEGDADIGVGGREKMSDSFARSVMAIEDEYPDLAADLARFDSLEDVLNWVRRRGGNIAEIQVIPQDEFTHDIVVDVSSDQFLAFEAT